MLDIRKPCMEMTNRICLKPLNSSRNKDTSTNFKFPTWKCLPNTLWSSRLSTRLGKVSIILFEKAADHRILTIQQNYSRNSDHIISFLPNTMRSFRLSTRLGKVNRILFKKSSWPQNSRNVSRIMVGILITISVFYRICCGWSGFQQD